MSTRLASVSGCGRAEGAVTGCTHSAHHTQTPLVKIKTLTPNHVNTIEKRKTNFSFIPEKMIRNCQ